MKIIFECSPQGDYVGLRYSGRSCAAAKSERKEIKAFSFRSRSRLMKKIAQLRKHHKPLFVTLTYPDAFPTDYQVYKYHVHKFFVYLFRRFPGCGVIWKLEFQDRGAAHFHILLYGVDISEAENWVPETWYKIAGNGDYRHLQWHKGLLGHGNKHCVQIIRSWHGVKSYASKYLGKPDSSTDKTGRFWGVRGDVPFSPLVALRIDIETALLFRRAFRRSSGMVFKSFGFWGYGFHADWLTFINHYEDELYKRLHEPDIPPRWYISPVPVPDENCIFF